MISTIKLKPKDIKVIVSCLSDHQIEQAKRAITYLSQVKNRNEGVKNSDFLKDGKTDYLCHSTKFYYDHDFQTAFKYDEPFWSASGFTFSLLSVIVVHADIKELRMFKTALTREQERRQNNAKSNSSKRS